VKEAGSNGGDGDDDSDTDSDGDDDASEASGETVSHAPRLPAVRFQAQKRTAAKVYKRGSSKRRTVENKFHHILPDLLRLCHVADPSDLAAIWPALEDGGKEDMWIILSKACTATSRRYQFKPPLITHNIMKRILAMNIGRHEP
jgi:hypothetical protein